MALPTILINSATGSDTTASGAGPGTALSGSTGRTRNTAAELRFGFFGATDDFSGVATDGSAVCFMSISTAGQRNFSSIAAVKNTRHVDVGDMTATSAVVSAIVSTSGWSIGDVIKVTGAGAAAADLYSTIVSVDSATQVTLNDAAGTTVSGVVVENPKQVTLTGGEGVNTGTTNTAWAVGGKRASIGSTTSVKLLENNSASGDAMPGWIIEMESGHTETRSATITIRRTGNTTSGPIIVRGASGAATMPIITFSNNGTAFVVTGAIGGWFFQDFELQNSNATKTASTAFSYTSGAGRSTIKNVRIAHSTNKFWKGMTWFNNGTDLTIQDCNWGYLANVAVEWTSGTCGITLANNYFHHCTSHGVFNNGSTSAFVPLRIIGNIIAYNGGCGIRWSATPTVTQQSMLLRGNVIHGNTNDGIEFTAATTGVMLFAATVIENNNFTFNGGYGINFSGASVTANLLRYYQTLVRNNVFFTNTSGKYIPSDLNSLDELTTDPSGGAASATTDYAGATNGSDFMSDVHAAKGYPIGGTLAVGFGSSSYNYCDIGLQHQDAGGSGGGGMHGGMQRS